MRFQRRIDPQKFQAIVASHFSARGEVRSNQSILGQLVDLVLIEKKDDGTRSITAIEVKAFSNPVEVTQVMAAALQFEPLVASSRVDRTMIVSASGFSAATVRAAETLGIELLHFEADRSVNVTSIDATLSVGFSVSSSPNPLLFVLLPFKEEFNDIYTSGIRAVASELGLTVERADNIQHDGDIMELVYNKIETCAAVIGDLTGNNPNVFYEVGYSHHVKPKHTILIAKSVNRLPFDLRGRNIVTY